MAYFHRLIIFVFIIAFSALAHSAIPKVSKVSSNCPYNGQNSGPMDNLGALCSSGFANTCAKAWDPSAFTRIEESGSFAGKCVRVLPGDWGDVIGGAFDVYPMPGCPANSDEVGGQCFCSEGFEEKDGQCKPVNPCPEGQHEEGGACVPDNCKPDEIRVNGMCVKEPDCPPGEQRFNGQCKKSSCQKGKDYGVFGTPSEEYVGYRCEYDYDIGQFCSARIRTSFSVTWTDGDGVQQGGYSGSAIGLGMNCVGGGDSDAGGGGTGNPGSGDGGSDGDHGDGTGGTGGTGEPGTGSGGGGTGGNKTGGSDSDSHPGRGNDPDYGYLPGVDPPTGSAPDVGSGECPSGTVKRDDKCYSTLPKPPDNDGKCEAGYIKVNTECVPLIPKEPPSGGTGGTGGTGGSGGNGKGGEGAFGGSCANGFTCSGDALLCALSYEQHWRNCRLYDFPTDESKLYTREKGKEGNRTTDLPGNESVDVTGRIDSSDAIGGGSCIADVNVTIMGKTATLPFSMLCPYLAMLGNILVAVAMLLAARIIMRG